MSILEEIITTFIAKIFEVANATTDIKNIGISVS
jgi:hypothetical protein